MGDTVEKFEFEICGKTYVSRKMNPVLRGKVLKTLDFKAFTALSMLDNFEKLSDADKNETMSAMGGLFESTPPLMWAFIRDEDKHKIGLYDDFLDALCDDESQVLKFLTWMFSKVSDINRFLAEGSVEPAVNQ